LWFKEISSDKATYS